MTKAKITPAALRKLFASTGDSSLEQPQTDEVLSTDLSDSELAEQITARMRVHANGDLPVIDTEDDYQEGDDLDEVTGEFDEFEDTDEPEMVSLDSGFDEIQGTGLDATTDEPMDTLDGVAIEEELEQANAATDDFEEDMGGEPVADLLEVDDEGDLEVIPVGDEVLAISANVVIAKMTKNNAVKAGVSDIYKGKSFAAVVQASVETKGLRKGLVAAGFKTIKAKAKANSVSQSAVKASVAKAVQAKAVQVKAELAAFEQATAIAAVGINRKFFKDTQNTLRAALENELTKAGMRNASVLVRSCFAKHGVDYAKDILVLAKKLAAQPQEVRDNYVEALDMTSTDIEEPVMVAETSDEFIDTPSNITAALLRPAQVKTPFSVNASTQAHAILAGTASLV